ncbi:hypothetical protein SAMN02910344_00911 [Ruminobacter amylophilus]|uniref:Phospholipase_D-nuclease N-terminal n=1 Tax=Ruminobacter amylophilus TaxID=867 RepID=A0A662ZHU6_9GAMM|nr:hypothetical protein [Ruminobacter amylophilus]SFP26485.1 hypothetical protein SAMN02910344_00911 [Ruminobacter amylophilus]
MNRLVYNLTYWPCIILTINLYRNSVEQNQNTTLLAIGSAVAIASIVIAGIRTKSMGKSLWNLIWLFIPFASFIYALYIGIANKKK